MYIITYLSHYGIYYRLPAGGEDRTIQHGGLGKKAQESHPTLRDLPAAQKGGSLYPAWPVSAGAPESHWTG